MPADADTREWGEVLAGLIAAAKGASPHVAAMPREGVEKAVRAIQRQEIAYREFCRQIAGAGCVGYFVSLTGRRAVYYGRTGDEHVQWFPGAKP